MHQSIKKIFSNNLLIKIIAFIFSYSVWTIASNAHLHTITVQAPLCFFNQPTNVTLQAPETVTLYLQASRHALRSLDIDALAIHMDASHMHEGTNPIALTHESLFLPNTIKLVHYIPAHIVVNAHETIER